MSFKAKNLEYDKTQPAFLRRLRSEITGSSGDSDRDLNPIARPKAAARLKNDDEDDGPTYVMEDTQDLLSKAEYEALINGEKSEHNSRPTGIPAALPKDDIAAVDTWRMNQKVAGVGGPVKKRKAARIGGDEEEGNGDGDSIGTNTSTLFKSRVGAELKPGARRKKTTAIKLSFGDDEEN